MKLLKLFMIAAIAMFAVACEKNTDEDDPIKIENGTYIGTLSVDQNNGSFYTQENVSIVLELDKSSATIKMQQVSFSSGMPVKLDMTIPNVVTASQTEGLSLSGNNIIPLAMGGEFPAYTITSLTGNVTKQSISFVMICGEFPLSFSGIIAEK